MLKVENISCTYATESAVNQVSFQIEQGMIACLLGPSGCGKTTVLRAIAGFQQLQSGRITLGKNLISSPKHAIPPEKRNLSMVFQDHALFPHLTVEKNICAGLHGKTKHAEKEIVEQMLRYVRLQKYKTRYPHELSGGQQQRVALARALAPKPRLLLMDEPFSNLDLDLRKKLSLEVRDLLKQVGTTCLMVTHDQQDAFTFSDQIGVMNEGIIEQWDAPYNLYHEPNSRFIADFVGDGVFLDAKVIDQNSIQSELGILQGTLKSDVKVGQNIKLLVRPDDIIHDDHSQRTAKIKKKMFRGESYLYTLVLASGNEILSLVPSHHNHAIGSDFGIRLEIDHLVYFS